MHAQIEYSLLHVSFKVFSCKFYSWRISIQKNVSTTEVSSGQSEEDDLFVEVDIDGSNENDDLPAKSSSFLRQLNQSLQTMVGSIMEKSLKRLHEDKTPPAKRKKPRLATETSGPEEVEENQNSDEDTRALCGPSNADSAEVLKPLTLDSSKTLSLTIAMTHCCQKLKMFFSQEDDMGQAITEKLATIINKRLSEKLSDQKLKEKRDQYPRPDNCDRLVAPRINPEIWARIENAKQLDLRASTNQSNLAKAGVVLAKSTDKRLSLYQKDSKPEYRELITLKTDALALLGHASCEMSQRRRETLKPHLNKEYTTLCASHVPVTSLLFGDDLQGQLTNIRATNKATQSVMRENNTKIHNNDDHDQITTRSIFYPDQGPQTAPKTASTKETKPVESKPKKSVTNPSCNINNPLSSLQVSNLALNITNMKSYFQTKIMNFQSGQISKHMPNGMRLPLTQRF